jgi:hypothetical protein
MSKNVRERLQNKSGFASDLGALPKMDLSFSQQFMLFSTTILLFPNSYKHQLFNLSETAQYRMRISCD